MNAAELEAISPDELGACVERLAMEISRDHPNGVLLIGVLDGSLCLIADLARALAVPCELDFLGISAYAPGARRVRIVKDLDYDIAGKAVVVVRDVVDTGLSTRYVHGLLTQRRAQTVRTCTLIERPARRIAPVALDYVGFSRGEEFLVGYGLDFAGRYRNLDTIYAIEPEALVAQQAAFEGAVYRRPSYRSGDPRE